MMWKVFRSMMCYEDKSNPLKRVKQSINSQLLKLTAYCIPLQKHQGNVKSY
jgi:hypothetical protein